MAPGRWISVVIATGCAVFVCGRAVLGAPAGGVTPIVESDVHRDLLQLETTLNAKASTQAQRDEAARRLASRGSAEARDILLRSLRDQGHDPELAVARSLADAPKPDAGFVEPVAQLLGSERALHEAAVRALARFTDNETARQRLIAFGRDNRQVTGLRAAAIRATGPMVDQRVAAALVDLLNDNRLSSILQNAAADALIEMTGLTENGRDPQRWKAWEGANANKPDANWKATVYQTRAARLDEVAQKYNHLIGELENILTAQYASAKDKSESLMRFLNSSEPDVRAIGSKIVRDSFLNSQPYSEKAPERLKELVGDSDVRVRLEVARTLKAINYGAALNALLTQLAQEPDTDVKLALIGAVAQIGDLKALPILRKLLQDPSLRVATSAAEAFVPRGGAAGKTLGQFLYESDKNLAHEVAQELWKAARQHAADPNAAEFRAAAIEALAPLRDSTLLVPLTQLLTNDEPERVRAAALRALGELGDPKAEDAISGWLRQERDAGVRLEALQALGTTGNFGLDAELLYSFFGPRSNEPDASVRERAWQVFQLLLPSASEQVLNTWAQKLRQEPQHRLLILLELNRKLLKNGDLEQLAVSRQNTGEVYLKLDEPVKAADYFGQALGYWTTHSGPEVVVEGLRQQNMTALLKGGDYPAAVDFASKSILTSKAQQTTMGSLIRDEVETLMQTADTKNDSNAYKSALRLIDEAMKMKPPLIEQYQDDLRRDQAEIRKKVGGTPSTPS